MTSYVPSRPCICTNIPKFHFVQFPIYSPISYKSVLPHVYPKQWSIIAKCNSRPWLWKYTMNLLIFLCIQSFLQAKHLQFVSGVDSFCYWFGTYTWDYLNYLIPATLFVIIFAAFQVEAFKDEMGAVYLLLVSLWLRRCISWPCLVYLLSMKWISKVARGRGKEGAYNDLPSSRGKTYCVRLNTDILPNWLIFHSSLGSLICTSNWIV